MQVFSRDGRQQKAQMFLGRMDENDLGTTAGDTHGLMSPLG